MRNLKLVVCAFALMALFAGLSPAAPIAYVTYGPFSAPTPGHPTDDTPWPGPGVSGAVTLPQFDTTLGKLVSVDITWTADVYGGFSVTNGRQNNFLYDMNWGGTMGFTSAVTGLNMAGTYLTDPSFPATYSIAGGATKVWDPLSGSTTGSFSCPDSACVALFTSNVVMNWWATASHGFKDSNGNALGQFDTFAKASATVKYGYEVPEPSTFVLLGSALCGLALWGRKRATR